MKWGLTADIVLTVYQMLLQCQAFSVKEVLVNEPVTLLCNCSGNCPSVQWTRFIPSKAVIAESRACRGDSHSEKRFAISRSGEGNSSLMISSVAYTDAGSYMCSCNGKPVTEVKLKVLVATVVKYFEGQDVTLQCYGDTRQYAKDVKWKKAGQDVLVYNHANGSVTTNDASESRYMMLVERFQDGDLSLYISSVRLSDVGLYQCLIHDESQDGEPQAVLLQVESLQQLPTTNSNEVRVLLVLLGLSMLVIIGLIVYIQTKAPYLHSFQIPNTSYNTPEVVFPLPAEEIQPATGAAHTVLLSRH